MKRLYVPPEQLRGALVRMTEAQRHYLRNVLRLEDGETLEVFDGRGGSYQAALEGEWLQLGEKLPTIAAPLDVILVQALAKGEKMDLIVQKATELGASQIVPLIAERAVVRVVAERGASKAERWRRIAQEAARQCGRADVPQVDEPSTWDEVLPLLGDRLGLLLDPEERWLRLGQAAGGSPRILLAVGPEGGFSAQEREAAVQGGFMAVGMGRLVLRTETAGLAALSIVQHVHGELG